MTHRNHCIKEHLIFKIIGMSLGHKTQQEETKQSSNRFCLFVFKPQHSSVIFSTTIQVGGTPPEQYILLFELPHSRSTQGM